MRNEYDAIVVGGGIAGLTSAAYLCRSGISTLLIEKKEKTGGLVNTFWYEGFAFDGGIRAFENSGIVLPMLKSLGIEMEFNPNQVSVGIDKKWRRLTSRDSLIDYREMLKEIFSENASDIDRIISEIKKVMEYMDVIYGIDNPLFLDDFKNPEYLTKTLLPWLFKYNISIRRAMKLNEPVCSYLKHFTNNEALIDMIAQHFFKGTPAFFALSYFGLYLDYFYPTGGTGVLAEKITEYIKSKGGVVLTGTAAAGIEPEKNEIALSDGQILGYKKLVWAADQKTLFSILKGGNKSKIEEKKTLVDKSKGSDSVLTLFTGIDLDRDYFNSRCGAHSFYTPDANGISSLPDWREADNNSMASLYDWVGAYLEKTTYEISCPALRDQSLVPQGKTGLIISTLLDYELVRIFYDRGEYDKLKKHCSQKILSVLERSIFPDINKKLMFSLCATPMTIEKETGNTQGAITGWAFTNPVMPSEVRFNKITSSIKTPIKDILQCGQWTFSPSGLPVSILTGKVAADYVSKALK